MKEDLILRVNPLIGTDFVLHIVQFKKTFSNLGHHGLLAITYVVIGTIDNYSNIGHYFQSELGKTENRIRDVNIVLQTLV